MSNTHGKILQLEKGEFIPRSVDAIFAYSPGCTWGELFDAVDLGARAKLKVETDEGGSKGAWDSIIAAIASETLRGTLLVATTATATLRFVLVL